MGNLRPAHETGENWHQLRSGQNKASGMVYRCVRNVQQSHGIRIGIGEIHSGNVDASFTLIQKSHGFFRSSPGWHLRSLRQSQMSQRWPKGVFQAHFSRLQIQSGIREGQLSWLHHRWFLHKSHRSPDSANRDGRPSGRLCKPSTTAIIHPCGPLQNTQRSGQLFDHNRQ